MTLLDIAERAELIQENTNKIVAAQSQQTKGWFVRFLVVMCVAAAAIVWVDIYSSNRIEARFIESQQPAPAVVRVTLTPLEDNPALCPGDMLRYLVTLNIMHPSVVEIDWNIRNLDTERTEIQSDTVRTIYDRAGVVNLQANWELPEQLPATNTRPERQWQPGQYRRLIALTGIEGETEASVVYADFRIREGC